MIVGFTGTKKGMTDVQKKVVQELVKRLKPFEFHHGDCVGADEQADGIAALFNPEIHVHPPTDNKLRAHTQLKTDGVRRVIWPPEPYLKRDESLAHVSDVLIATPKEFEEVIRSGTWTTVRRARKAKRKIYKVFPDGSIAEEN